jgi:asparagine synthase (glutamine-hydrolysing)
VLLVHTRLAIQDLSLAGHQPMEWEGKSSVDSLRSSAVADPAVAGDELEQATGDRRPKTDDPAPSGPVIVFNGEIYNFRELRAELEAEGWVFRTRTDTEVILALYVRDGQRCVERLRGMFAFVIWDEAARSVFLARDPLGIKPLYLCEGDGKLAFASELRALVRAGLCGREIDAAGLASFLSFGAVVEPGTILEGVTKLPAGHAMEWKDGQSRTWAYWKPELVPQQEVPEAVAQARRALLDSVRAHLVSDAPVGVFLSGGMDSTAMAVLAQEAGIGELRTFSIGFAEEGFDESGPARRTAEALGAKHHEWKLGAVEGRELVKDFVGSLDQPTIDGFNTYCVSKFAREGGCKVVVSGLGGDEILGGYGSFRQVPKLCQIYRLLGWVPGTRQVAGRFLRSSRNPVRRRVGEFLAGSGSVTSAYEACRSLFTASEAAALVGFLLNKEVPAAAVAAGTAIPAALPVVTEDAVSVLELTRYMRNQLLRDSDVMSMRWGLELRVPMVDAELFEALGQIPHGQRLAPGKWLLGEAVPEIPAEIRNQAKRGFTFPFAQWMAGDWQAMLESSGQGAPVALPNWYQKWALFIFQQWKEQVLGDRVAGEGRRRPETGDLREMENLRLET